MKHQHVSFVDLRKFVYGEYESDEKMGDYINGCIDQCSTCYNNFQIVINECVDSMKRKKEKVVSGKPKRHKHITVQEAHYHCSGLGSPINDKKISGCSICTLRCETAIGEWQ